MRITRTLTIPALALALLAGGTAAANLTGGGVPTPPVAPAAAPAAGCEEDMPCWDCETMGNLICGLPDIQANTAHRAAAWDAWDRAKGWTLLRVDPSREVRVDVVGYALTRPDTGPAEVAIHAGDRWYVFTSR